jgi:hypothetical protein
MVSPLKKIHYIKTKANLAKRRTLGVTGGVD